MRVNQVHIYNTSDVADSSDIDEVFGNMNQVDLNNVFYQNNPGAEPIKSEDQLHPTEPGTVKQQILFETRTKTPTTQILEAELA